MAKYADIEPFYEWLEDLMRLDTSNYPDMNTLMFYEIMDELDSLPEVVRCKDCHNFTKSKWCNLLMMDVKDDGFCSYGERKDL